MNRFKKVFHSEMPKRDWPRGAGHSLANFCRLLELPFPKRPVKRYLKSEKKARKNRKYRSNKITLHSEMPKRVWPNVQRSFSCRCRDLGLPLPVRPYKQNPAYQKEYRKSHREHLNFEAARRKRERRKANPEKARAVARKEGALRRQNPAQRMRSNLSRRINKAIKGISKSAYTVELVGCSIEFFMSHLQSLFRPGMTWENYGPVWHVDHIKPCALFDLTDPEQQKTCFSWKNQQPLFALENLRKNAKYASPA